MSTQQSILKADFSDLSFEQFGYEFKIFLQYYFSDLSKIKAFVSAFEHSLPSIVIPSALFESFIKSFNEAFNVQINLPALPPLVNFFYFRFFI